MLIYVHPDHYKNVSSWLWNDDRNRRRDWSWLTQESYPEKVASFVFIDGEAILCPEIPDLMDILYVEVRRRLLEFPPGSSGDRALPSWTIDRQRALLPADQRGFDLSPPYENPTTRVTCDGRVVYERE